jgi:hypothetical protein
MTLITSYIPREVSFYKVKLSITHKLLLLLIEVVSFSVLPVFSFFVLIGHGLSTKVVLNSVGTISVICLYFPIIISEIFQARLFPFLHYENEVEPFMTFSTDLFSFNDKKNVSYQWKDVTNIEYHFQTIGRHSRPAEIVVTKNDLQTVELILDFPYASSLDPSNVSLPTVVEHYAELRKKEILMSGSQEQKAYYEEHEKTQQEIDLFIKFIAFAMLSCILYFLYRAFYVG